MHKNFIFFLCVGVFFSNSFSISSLVYKSSFNNIFDKLITKYFTSEDYWEVTNSSTLQIRKDDQTVVSYFPLAYLVPSAFMVSMSPSAIILTFADCLKNQGKESCKVKFETNSFIKEIEQELFFLKKAIYDSQGKIITEWYPRAAHANPFKKIGVLDLKEGRIIWEQKQYVYEGMRECLRGLDFEEKEYPSYDKINEKMHEKELNILKNKNHRK